MWENYLCCVDPGESGGFFCFFLAGRRSPLTRAPILCEPEVSLVGKFRFFRVEPSVIESMVLETSSADDFTIDIHKKFSYYYIKCSLTHMHIS